MNNYYFVNVVDEDLAKVAKFSELIEGKYEKDVLTGLNFAQITDKTFLLSLVFQDKKAKEESMKLTEGFAFLRVYDEEEDWIALMSMCSVCIVGNFTYKMLKSPQTEGSITIDMTTYKKLKKSYEQALKDNKKSFMFENTELIVDYAKYLLQYMESKLDG